jgi:hypothetical protein
MSLFTSVVGVILNRSNCAYQRTLKKNLERCERLLENKSKHIQLLYKTDDYCIGLSEYVIDEEGLEMPLSALLGSDKRFVSRFSEINCITCVSEQMSLITEYPAIKAKTICLATYHRQIDLVATKRMSGLSDPIYNIPFNKLNCELEKLKLPYYFIVDENHNASHFFVPSLEDIESTRKYLEFVSTLLK